MNTDTTDKRIFRTCDCCGDWALTPESPATVVCDQCKLDQGEMVEANIGGGSPATTNTQWIVGRLMRPYEPGDDLLLDVYGIRFFVEAKRVYTVYRAAPGSGGF